MDSSTLLRFPDETRLWFRANIGDVDLPDELFTESLDLF